MFFPPKIQKKKKMLERNGWMHIINSEYYDKSCVDWYAGRKRVAHELGLNSHISHSVSYPTQSRLKAGFLLFWSFINTPVCNFLMAWLRILEGNEYFYLFLLGSFKNTELIEVTHACNPYPPTPPLFSLWHSKCLSANGGLDPCQRCSCREWRLDSLLV